MAGIRNIVGSRGWRFFSLLILVFFLTDCRKAHRVGLEFDIIKKKLSNGLEVLMVQDESLPIISYQTWVKVGSVDEQPGRTGIAHLFEHMMFKGTKKYGHRQFFEQLEARGAEVNAFTTRDHTVYYANFTPNLLEQVIDMEADRLMGLILDDKVLNTERQVVLEERRLRTDNSPMGKMQEALWMMAYLSHPYRHPVIGSPDDLMRLKVAEIQEFYQKFYQPNNVAVVIVGDIDPDATFTLIKKHYGSLKKGPENQRNIVAEEAQQAERRMVLRDHVGASSFLYGYHITAAREQDTYAIDILSNILFDGTSSRAHQTLVEDTQTMVAVNGSSYTPTFPGLFVISSTLMEGKTIAEGEKRLNEIIQKVQKEGVTQDEVDMARAQLTVQLIDGVRTRFGLGRLIGIVHTTLGDADLYGEDIDAYQRVTPKDVQKAAQKYLHPNNRTVIELVPQGKGKS